MNIETEVPVSPAESVEEIRKRIESEMHELGLEDCPEDIVERFVLIEEHSKFNQDSRMIREGFSNVMDAINSKYAEEAKMTEKHKKEGELAAYLHDIGKSSSSEESQNQIAIIKLFSAESIRDENQMVSEAVSSTYPEEKDEMMSQLKEAGVDGSLTMREFWNMHAGWTREILDRHSDVLSERVRLIAASHHIDRGINPYHVEEGLIPDESKIIGSLEYYADFLEERALMALDKYQAAIFRGGASHDSAMEYLRNAFQRYQKDPVMKMVIETIDELGKDGKLFPVTAKQNLAKREK
jgi:hypothetical protein